MICDISQNWSMTNDYLSKHFYKKTSLLSEKQVIKAIKLVKKEISCFI